MTDEPEEQAPAPAPVVPPDLRLRGERSRVTRLSRKVLITLGAVSALAIAGALGYALQTHNKSQTGQELLEHPKPAFGRGPGRAAERLYRPAAAGAATRPPRCLATSASRSSMPARRRTQPRRPPAPDPAAQRLAQETEAARVSRLFAQTNQQPQPVSLVASPATATQSGPTPTPPVDAGSAQNMQDRKTAFLNAATDKRTISPDRLETKASPYVVQAGTVIPAALITGIRSDLPGQITAQVTEAVYDSPTGQYLLIPQGAKLIGQYDSSVAFGQSRILLVWTRIIMPDGKSIVLERQPGADTQGYAGLEDEVDNHWGKLFQAAVLSTLLSVGAEAGTSQNEYNLVQAIRSGASNSISQTGQQIVQRQLNIQPTLTIRPGFPVRVIVTRDLVLAPYGRGGRNP